jgi:hypothetical protein
MKEETDFISDRNYGQISDRCPGVHDPLVLGLAEFPSTPLSA